MNHPEFEEKRKYQRIQKHFVLSYFDASRPQEKFSGTQLKNISAGGLCLITEKDFPPGTVLSIEIKSTFFNTLRQLQAEVLESQECVKGIIYNTRVQFKNILPEEQETIDACIKFFNNKENGYA